MAAILSSRRWFTTSDHTSLQWCHGMAFNITDNPTICSNFLGLISQRKPKLHITGPLWRELTDGSYDWPFVEGIQRGLGASACGFYLYYSFKDHPSGIHDCIIYPPSYELFSFSWIFGSISSCIIYFNCHLAQSFRSQRYQLIAAKNDFQILKHFFYQIITQGFKEFHGNP